MLKEGSQKSDHVYVQGWHYPSGAYESKVIEEISQLGRHHVLLVFILKTVCHTLAIGNITAINIGV